MAVTHPQTLWHSYKTHGDEQARADLIRAYARLVPNTRARIIPSVPHRVAVEDIEQVGIIALIRAVDRFDPNRKVKFESYAISMIRGAMLEHLRQEDWAPRSVRDKQRALAAAAQALMLEDASQPVTAERLAVYFGQSREWVADLQRGAEEVRQISLDDLEADNSAGGYLDPFSVADSVPDPSPGPFDVAAGRLQAERVRELVGYLPAVERRVVRLYYTEGKTLKQIAGAIGLSESRAHQLHAGALQRLRQWADELGELPTRNTGRRRKAVHRVETATLNGKHAPEHAMARYERQIAEAAEREGIDLGGSVSGAVKEAWARELGTTFAVIGVALAAARKKQGLTVKRGGVRHAGFAAPAARVAAPVAVAPALPEEVPAPVAPLAAAPPLGADLQSLSLLVASGSTVGLADLSPVDRRLVLLRAAAAIEAVLA